ncbi:MAG: endonuclease/exonuclease/phosphatase family protein [Syntrophobacteraceae bacterium]
MLIMTFNLRFQNDFDGDNGWESRKELVVGLISRYSPTILGTQEGTVGQLRYLQKHLSGYELYAPQRYWDEDCQYCSLFFRSGELRAVDGGEFWLSETPDIHRSLAWDSAFPRMLSFGFFEDAVVGRRICAAVTHLDNIGAEARKQQARIICEWFSRQDCPLVLAGDFNDHPGSAVHGLLLNNGLLDTWQVLGKREDESGMTYHKFQGIPQFFRMDWIFVSPELSVVDAQVVYDCSPTGRYPSDHFPYMAQVAWP